MIDFDRHILTSLPAEILWSLMKEAFENPAQSPIWPVELDEVDPIELRPGAIVTATYKLGPFRTSPQYKITELSPGAAFAYESLPGHPLKGGARVEVIDRAPHGSTLHWSGSYSPRLHPSAPAAILFVKTYFLRTFFGRLEANIRRFESSKAHP